MFIFIFPLGDVLNFEEVVSENELVKSAVVSISKFMILHFNNHQFSKRVPQKKIGKIFMVRFGIDNIVKINPAWKNENIGLITNAAATNTQLVPSRKLLKDLDFNIKKLFSPEHGFDLRGVDGAKMDDFVDVLTQLPIISLYGNKLMPSADDLNDIDLLLFDIPDVGCRYYTNYGP